MSKIKTCSEKKTLEILYPVGSHYSNGVMGLMEHVKDLLFHGKHKKENAQIAIFFDTSNKEGSVASVNIVRKQEQ